ncbi:hypothetical protein CLF_101689 [Clonorchis sinensis]|uniref:Peptidase A2 domain-containing protein n=2 Tax=Clonorchis sinensis TaxID=79923 RepID=G7Y6C0_CLOSI|nr:hypothetical protein CLF_101689 [Clonorchis sinensis]
MHTASGTSKPSSRVRPKPKSNTVGSSFSLLATFQVNTPGHRKYLTVTINGHPVRLQLDTASDITIISEKLRRTLEQPPIRQAARTATSACSGELRLSDEFQCCVPFRGTTFVGSCYVTAAELNLLGLDWFGRLGLAGIPISIICVVTVLSQLSSRSEPPKLAYKDYNCASYFRIVYRDKCLQIIRFNMCHNHDLSSNNWQIYPSNRKLSEEQERTLLSILPSCPSYMVIRNYVQANYGITLSRDDVRRLRKRISCLEQQPAASETTQLTNHNASLPRTSSHLPAFRDTDSDVAGSENHNLPVSSAVTSEKDRRDIATQLTFEIFHALVRLDSTWFNHYHALFKQILEHMCPPERSAPEVPKIGTTSPGLVLTGIGSVPKSFSADETVFAVQNYKPILPKPQPAIKWTPPNSSRRPVKRLSWLPLSSNTTTTTTKRRRKSPLPKHSDKMLGFDRTVEMVGVIPQMKPFL